MPHHRRAASAASSSRTRHRAPDPVGAVDPLREEDPPLELETNELEDQISALLEEHGGGLVVRLERKPIRYAGVDYAAGYLGTIPAGDGDLLELVRERWGGGQYVGRVADGRRIRGRIQFSIAGKPKDEETPAPVAVASAADARLERLEGILERVLEKMAAPAPVVDELARLKQTAQLFNELRPAAAAPAPAAGSPVSILKDWLELQELLGSSRGGASEGDSLSSVVKQALPPLLSTINKKIESDGEMARLRIAHLRGRAVATVPAPAKILEGSDDPLAELLADIPGMAIEYLANMAALEKDAALYASMVLDNLPGDVVDRLPELLAGDSAVVGARLVAIVPAWAPYPAWFGELVRELLEAQAEQAAADAAEGRQ